MSREAKILGAILVVVVGGLIGLFVMANKGSSTPAPVGDKTKIIRDNTHKEGSGSVQFVEFGDFECPACGAAFPTVEQIKKDYNGKVTFYFRNFPLTQVHKNATISAEAAEAAGEQGKYWEMHDKLYQSQKDWSEDADPTEKLAGYAKELGLDVDKFKAALTSDQVKAVIDQDTADANALNINGTPTFYVNGVQVTSGFAYPNLRDAIEAQLNKK